MGWESPAAKLRLFLSEKIPEGGSDTDTYFSDAEIENILEDANGDTRRAAYIGWQAKAAYYADLVTVSEGNAIRQMSDAYDHAVKMAKLFGDAGSVLTAGRTRIGRIRRLT
jgi:hypothetical protein